MKVLSLYPEHVEAFRRGLRTIETRTWSTTYRGPLALYATKRNPLSMEALEDPVASRVMFELLRECDPAGVNRIDLTRGAITVVADLVACLPIFEDPLDVPAEGPFIYADEDGLLEVCVDDDDPLGSSHLPEGRYGMFEQGNHGLVLANPRPIEPVTLPRARVPQGRPWELRDDELDQVLAQLDRVAA